jgi:hypothetical protein
MCIGKGGFDRHWRGVAAASLLLFGPLTVASNLLAQQIPFNAIFLVSDPMQKWRSIPKGFDPRRLALIVVFFHGNAAALARDVRDRQQVPREVAESGLNAVPAVSPPERPANRVSHRVRWTQRLRVPNLGCNPLL